MSLRNLLPGTKSVFQSQHNTFEQPYGVHIIEQQYKCFTGYLNLTKIIKSK